MKKQKGIFSVFNNTCPLFIIILGLIAVISTSSGCGGGGSDDGGSPILGQNEQEWHGTTDEGGEVYFRVSGSNVEGFEIYAYLTGGYSGFGWLWLGIDPEMIISGNSFSFSGSYYNVTGTFTDSTNCTGTWDYHDPSLGYSSGTWTARLVPVLSVTPAYQDVTSHSGSINFTVTNANEGSGTMSWTAETDPLDSWINITSGNSGTNTGTISVNYEENEGGDVRVATITIISPEAYNSPQTVEIRQKAYNPYVEHKLLASDGAWSDHFGSSVSISGDYAIAGAPGDDDRSGSAYIFERIGTQWVQVAKLAPSDGAYADNFGHAVSISGDYAIVGSYYDDDNGTNSGSAYIFEKPAGGWTDMTETAKLVPSDGAAYDYFGNSVSISGDYAIVGSYWDDDNGTNSGSAYIFEKPAGGWTDITETAKLVPSDGDVSDNFGNAVSISGDYAIVGSYWDDDNGTNSGSAYIFEKPAGGWTDITETAKLVPSDGDVSDNFGNAVSISGDYAIVGAHNDDSSGDNSGSAYIFERPAGGWADMTETAKLVPSDGDVSDNFGRSVGISGDYVIVGADGDDPQLGSGSAYIYYLNVLSEN
jgi:hypothetical protein